MTSNANLQKNIFTYLDAKDLANIENVCREFHKNAQSFNFTWREECNKYFCSEYEYNNMINNHNIQKEYKDYFEKQACKEDQINWKILFKEAIKNRKMMQNFKVQENFSYLNFREDLSEIEKMIFSILKEHLTLPKLRKQKLYVENEINSTHQIQNYDFLNNQNDLYEFYDNIFKKNTDNKFLNFDYLHNFYIKREDLFFAKGLQNYTDLFMLFNKNDNVENKMKLGKLRWYCCDEHLLFPVEENKTIESEDEHPIIYVLKSIFAKIVIFCRITFNYIKKYQICNNYEHGDLKTPDKSLMDHILLNEYVKRYRSFFESAIEINNQLENLNVIVNYLYENLFEGYPSTPKFSIYRMMVVVWHKEVLHPLLETENENFNLISKTTKIFREYFNNIINRIGNRKDDLKCGYNFNFEDSSTSFNEDQIYYADKQDILKYLIEQVAASILDYDCNEYSIYFVNSTQIKISEFYNQFEESISKTFTDLIGNFILHNPDNTSSIFCVFKDLDTHFKFINRTKIALLKILCEECVEKSAEILKKKFSEFLKIFTFTLNDAASYMILNSNNIALGNEKSKNFLQIQHINKEISQIALDFYNDERLAAFATNYFFTEIKNNMNLKLSHNFELISSIENGISIYYEELKSQEKLNLKIIKENKKRFITLEMIESEFLNYIPINFTKVEEIFIYNKIQGDIEIFNKELEKRNKISEFQIIKIEDLYIDCKNILTNAKKL